MEIELDNLKSFEKIYLGFSGGADSTALAHLLVNKSICFTAVHFHHHLRGESADNDALFCKIFCDNFQISFRKIDLYVKDEMRSGESVESAARRLRQEWWQKNIEQEKSVVLLAHHKDDQRENFILRSLRGSSATGLTGFKRRKNILGVNYFRPLFNFTREEIISYLKVNNLSWQEDDSNQDLDFNRNRVRHSILPELTKLGSVNGLDRTIVNTAKDADYLEEIAQNWLKENEFTAENFIKCHDALKARIVRYFFQSNTDQEYYPGHEAIARLLRECQKSHDKPIEISLTEQHKIYLDQLGKFYMPPAQFHLEWHWKKQGAVEVNGYFIKTSINNYTPELKGESFLLSLVPEKLTLRNFQPGDRLIPFNRQSPVKVKKLLNDKKMSAEEKLKAPMLLAEDQIIWIPGVKRSKFGIAKPGDKVLLLTYERI